MNDLSEIIHRLFEICEDPSLRLGGADAESRFKDANAQFNQWINDMPNGLDIEDKANEYAVAGFAAYFERGFRAGAKITMQLMAGGGQCENA